MLRIERILHPTDFSTCAQRALDDALDLALHLSAELHVLHAASNSYDEPDGPPDAPEWEEENLRIRLRETVNARLGRFEHEALDDLNVQYTVVQGDAPAPLIHEYARTHDVDLIVMGTHGRRGMRQLFVGSVAEEVMHATTCPVWTVRIGEKPAPKRTIRHIVAPVDFSSYAARSVVYAKEMAALFGASLSLLFVAEERTVPHFSDTGIPTFVRLSMEDDAVEQAQAALRQLFEETEGPEVPVSYHVRRGHPVPEILTFAGEEKGDLIVMSTRGHREPVYFSLGSVTERVMRRAACPLFIVPGKVPSSEDSSSALQQQASDEPEMSSEAEG